MLFIDGGHEYDTVINDFEKFAPLVSKNGFIIFDDYMMFEVPVPRTYTKVEKERKGQVRRAVDVILEKNKKDYNVIGILPNTAKAFKQKWPYNPDFIIQKK